SSTTRRSRARSRSAANRSRSLRTKTPRSARSSTRRVRNARSRRTPRRSRSAECACRNDSIARTTPRDAAAAPEPNEPGTHAMSTSSADANAAPRKGSRRLLKIGIATLSAAAALTFGLQWYTSGRYHEKTEDAYVGGDLTVIAPKVAGHISDLFVQDNQ